VGILLAKNTEKHKKLGGFDIDKKLWQLYYMRYGYHGIAMKKSN
jgi:hypothetical protein